MNKLQKYLVIALTAISPMLTSYNVVSANDKTTMVSHTTGKYHDLELAHVQLVELIRTYNIDLNKAKEVQLALIAKAPSLMKKMMSGKWLNDAAKEHALQPHHDLQQSRAFLEDILTQQTITDYNKVFAYLAKLEQVISALKANNTLATFVKTYRTAYENSPNQQFKDVIRLMAIMADDTITLSFTVWHKAITDVYLKSDVRITKQPHTPDSELDVTVLSGLKLRNENMLAKDLINKMSHLVADKQLTHWQVEENSSLAQYFAAYLMINTKLLKKINTLPEADILPSLLSYYADIARHVLNGATAVQETVQEKLELIEEVSEKVVAIVEKTKEAVEETIAVWHKTNRE